MKIVDERIMCSSFLCPSVSLGVSVIVCLSISVSLWVSVRLTLFWVWLCVRCVFLSITFCLSFPLSECAHLSVSVGVCVSVCVCGCLCVFFWLSVRFECWFLNVHVSVPMCLLFWVLVQICSRHLVLRSKWNTDKEKWCRLLTGSHIFKIKYLSFDPPPSCIWISSANKIIYSDIFCYFHHHHHFIYWHFE